jgi:hypothetical protein
VTYDATISALGDIVDECAADGDRTGYFAAMYLAVTNTVRQRAGEGRFEDPASMERFVSGFAARYLDALAAWRTGGRCPRSWVVAFQAASRWRPIILQHLLLGINAHINLDLGVACARTSPGDQLPALHGDFLRINALLGGLMNTVVAELSQVSPFIGLIARVIGDQDDDEIGNFALGAARDFAWHVAESLAPLPIALQAPKIAVLDKIVAAFGKHLARPDELLAAAYRVIRSAETASVADVIEVLAAE